MNLKLTAYIEDCDSNGCVAWIDGLKGMVVQGSNQAEAWKELILSLKIKISFDFGVPMSSIGKMNEDSFRTLESGESKRDMELTLSA